MNPAKILVVDDEPLILEELTEALQSEGYEVDAVKSGEEALAKYQHNYYNVVLVDWKMPPGMNGIEVMKHIDAQLPRPHVIMMTAFGTEETSIEAHHHHAFDYLKKPVGVDVVLASVKEALDRKDGVISALENWVEAHPEQAAKPTKATLAPNGERQEWSAKQILDEIRRNTPRGQHEYQKLIKLTIDLLTRNVIKDE